MNQQMTIPQAIDLAKRHHQAGQFAQAESIYRQVLSAQPNHGEALHLLGLIAQQAGRADIAADLIARAIQIEPHAIHYQANYAQCLVLLNRFDDALTVMTRVVTLQPNFPEAHYNLGNLLKLMNRPREAAAAYRNAIAGRSDYPEALNNLGNILRELGELPDAIATLRRAIMLSPALAEAHLNLGNALLDDDQLDAAIDAFNHSLALRPNQPDAINGIASAEQGKGRPERAMELYRKALSIDQRHIAAMNNLARTHGESGQPELAIAVYRNALANAPDHPAIHYNLGLALLQNGELSQGFREYEWRWKTEELGLSLKPVTAPIWDGSPLDGRKILIFAEQGFGDALQFCRYLPMVAQRGGKIVLRCQPSLVPLLQNIKGVERIIQPDEPLTGFDVHCPLMSLPNLFQTTLDTIPATVPYLAADDARMNRWKDRIEQTPKAFRVGIVWAGLAKHKNDQRRSLPLAALAPLLDVEGVQFFSLQKGEPAGQLKELSTAHVVRDWTADLHDFADTAALIAQLDLIVCVDTAVAHLAGALGRPTWLLLPFQSEWRWLRDRDDSPWYPTMRLFRQRAAGDWSEPVARIRQRLLEQTAGAADD